MYLPHGGRKENDMNSLVIILIAVVVLGAGYLGYGRWLAKKWGIDADDIKICTPNRTVNQVARHLRNSIGHNRFEYDCPLCASKPIEEISFKDLSSKNNITFQATLKFKDFSNFVLKIANFAVEN